MSKDSWLTEKEICDQLETKGIILRHLSLLPNPVLLRECPIYQNYRPDFLLVESTIDPLILEEFGKDISCWITPVEVKITATIDSVMQVANYYWILNRIDPYELRLGKYKKAEFSTSKPVLIARYFDQKVLEVAGLLDCLCYRIKSESNDVLDLEHQVPDFGVFGKFANDFHSSKDCVRFVNKLAFNIARRAGIV